MQTLLAANPFITCGMYIFGSATERAWRALLAPFGEICYPGEWQGGAVDLRFDSEDASYLSTEMLLGHTCGYPLIKKWYRSHQPVSVAVFDIPGCTGQLYSSWFISHPGNHYQYLSKFAGSRVAINDPNSNSGMNVLRHALSEVVDSHSPHDSFFKSVVETGSHHNSMLAVAAQRADLAAIDAVSYHHLLQLHPALATQTRIVGQSVSTPGLPFIVHKQNDHGGCSASHSESITGTLNICLEMLDHKSRDLLKINRFEAVDISAYRALSDIENSATERGYSQIR